MSTLHASLYAAALIGCVLLWLVARQLGRQRPEHTRYLLSLLALQSLNFAFEWLMSNPDSPAKSLWLASIMALAFFLGPCLWLYARDIAEPATPRLRDLPRGHFVPVAVGLLLLLPLAVRTHLGNDFIDPARPASAAHSLFIHVALLAAVLIFALQALYYLRASLEILHRQASAAKALFSDLEDRELNTLRLLILVVGAHWLVGIARTLHCLLLGKDAGFVILFVLAEVAITLWAVASFMRSNLHVKSDDRRLANELAPATVAPRYAKSALDAPARARIGRKLSEAWAVQQLHLDSQLTLRVLCERLRENPHYVSQVINQDLGTSFYDLVNRQRVLGAMDRLQRQPDRPVAEIAVEVGFNSKSTFNAAFRQHAGTTPSEFRLTRVPAAASLTSGPSG